MRIVAITLLAMMMASAVLANVYVGTDADGNATGIATVQGKMAKVNHNKNQYSDAEWVAFGITQEAPYIIKDGDAWRDMTVAEIAVVDASIQEKVTVEASADVDMDALFQAIADAVKNNLKTKAEVKDAFKNGVDPKKEKKK